MGSSGSGQPVCDSATRDRVSEVYGGAASNRIFQRHLRNRIHWMCSQAKGPRVLDAGCSQGIASILLAREGLQVVGVDVAPEAIAEAQEALGAESNAVRANVRFVVGNLLEPLPGLEPFDTILAGEILEHLLQPERFVARCWELLAKDGRLVVTVPFGVHSHPDHKHTFYLGSLVRTLSPYFRIEQLRLLHTAEGANSPAPLIGAVAHKQTVPSSALPPTDDRWLTVYDQAAAAAEARYVSQLERVSRRVTELDQRLRLRETELKAAQEAADEGKRARQELDEVQRLLVRVLHTLAGICPRVADAVGITLPQDDPEASLTWRVAQMLLVVESLTRALQELSLLAGNLRQGREELAREWAGVVVAARDLGAALYQGSSGFQVDNAPIADLLSQVQDQALVLSREGPGQGRMAELGAGLASLLGALGLAWANLREQVDEADARIAQLQTSLQSAQQQLRGAQEAAAAREQALQTEVTAARAEAKRLQQEAAQARANSDRAQQAEERLLQRSAALERDLATLCRQVDEADARIAQLQTSLQSAQQQLRGAQEAAAAREQALQTEVTAARAEAKRLQQEAAQARANSDRAQQAEERLLQRSAALERDLATLCRVERGLRAACRDRDRAILWLRRRLGMMEQATSYRLGLLIIRSVQRPYLLPLLPFRMVAMLARARAARRRTGGRRRERRLADLPVELAPVPGQPSLTASLQPVPSEKGTGEGKAIAPSTPLVTAPMSVSQHYPGADADEETETDRLLIAGLYEDPRRTQDLRIAVIMDEFSLACFRPECHVVTFRPDNWRPILRRERPHMLLVESAWRGNGGSWEYRVARYAYPGWEELERLVAWCRQHGIRTAFWNKEDPVHFDRFLDTAKLFDFVFTTDANCIPRYKHAVGHDRVYPLAFAAQPRLHNPIRVPGYRQKTVCFAGSYYRNRHPRRREEMDWLLEAGLGFGLEIYDRGFGQRGRGSEDFCFPERFTSAVVGGVAYQDIVRVYKQYKVFLNVNSVADSPTMFSRRVFELLACGTPVVSTPARAIDELLGREVVQVVSSAEEARAVLQRLLADDGWRERLGLTGQRLIAAGHTYAHRLHEIASRLGFQVDAPQPPRISAILWPRGDSDPGAAAAALYPSGDVGVEFVVVARTGEAAATRERLRGLARDESVLVLESASPADGAWWQESVKASSGDYLTLLAPGDHYGPRYLDDLVRALSYADADAVGKACFLSVGEGSEVTVTGQGCEYAYTPRLLPAAMLAKRDLAAQLGWPGDRLHDPSLLESWAGAGARLFSADRFNYVRGGGDRDNSDTDV